MRGSRTTTATSLWQSSTCLPPHTSLLLWCGRDGDDSGGGGDDDNDHDPNNDEDDDDGGNDDDGDNDDGDSGGCKPEGLSRIRWVHWLTSNTPLKLPPECVCV